MARSRKPVDRIDKVQKTENVPGIGRDARRPRRAAGVHEGDERCLDAHEDIADACRQREGAWQPAGREQGEKDPAHRAIALDADQP